MSDVCIFTDHALVGGVFAVYHDLHTPIDCALVCNQHPRCQSYNFAVTTQTCGLNNETKSTVNPTSTYIVKPGYNYYETAVSTVVYIFLGYNQRLLPTTFIEIDVYLGYNHMTQNPLR